jgi:hypothetical protein
VGSRCRPHTSEAHVYHTLLIMRVSLARRWNLSYTKNCHRSAYVTPKKGRAILFYNHLSAFCYEGQQWGCELGEMDKYSLHGGCDVLKVRSWHVVACIGTRCSGCCCATL